MRIYENLSAFLILLLGTAQSIIERQFEVVGALVVFVLLDQIFISLLVRLPSKGSWYYTVLNWRSGITIKTNVW